MTVDITKIISPKTKIEDINLSNRSYRALKRNGVDTVGQAIKQSELFDGTGLQEFKNLGKVSEKEIKQKLRRIKDLQCKITS